MIHPYAPELGTQYPLFCLLRYSETHLLHPVSILDSRVSVCASLAQQRIIFFSHQWTSYAAPDPDNIQYATMLAAVQRVQTAYKWPLEQTFIWVE